MSEPKNPDTIVLQNSYYPQGIKEIDIWNYYNSIKFDLIKNTEGRELILYLIIDGKIVVKRQGPGNKPLRLTNKTFDDIITGRTLSIHVAMEKNEHIGIIDIDTDDFRLAKHATLEALDYVMSDFHFINRAEIRFTGKTSFHIICHLKRKGNIDAIKFLIKRTLQNSPLARKYTIDETRKSKEVNLDLSPNKFRGGFIPVGSLSVIGLKCVELNTRQLATFNPILAKVKT